jgi:glycerophosphoryl diester phosphodiesterase
MRLARAVVDEVRRVGAARRTILITYSPETARAVAALAPEMMISVGVQQMADLEGLNPRQVLAWTGTRQPNPALWAALNARGVEAQFGTLGAEGRRWDDRYAEDGSVSEYRDLVAQGVTVIATDAPLAVKGVLGAEIAAAATCER